MSMELIKVVKVGLVISTVCLPSLPGFMDANNYKAISADISTKTGMIKQQAALAFNDLVEGSNLKNTSVNSKISTENEKNVLSKIKARYLGQVNSVNNNSKSDYKGYGISVSDISNDGIGDYLMFETNESGLAPYPNGLRYHVETDYNSTRQLETAFQLSIEPSTKGYMVF